VVYTSGILLENFFFGAEIVPGAYHISHDFFTVVMHLPPDL
jgi:hypothetical protein